MEQGTNRLGTDIGAAEKELPFNGFAVLIYEVLIQNSRYSIGALTFGWRPNNKFPRASLDIVKMIRAFVYPSSVDMDIRSLCETLVVNSNTKCRLGDVIL